MNPAQIASLEKSLNALIEAGNKKDAKLNEALERLDKAESTVKQLQRLNIARSSSAGGVRRQGTVSEECARHLAATFILLCARSGRLEAFCDNSTKRDAWLTESRSALGRR